MELDMKCVSGRVVWQDGSPVTDVPLRLHADGRYVRLINVDKNGRFSVKVYGDFKYDIEARAFGPGRHGKTERIAITDKSTNLKLILKPE